MIEAIDPLEMLEEALNVLLGNATEADESELMLVYACDVKLLREAFDSYLEDTYGNCIDRF